MRWTINLAKRAIKQLRHCQKFCQLSLTTIPLLFKKCIQTYVNILKKLIKVCNLDQWQLICTWQASLSQIYKLLYKQKIGPTPQKNCPYTNTIIYQSLTTKVLIHYPPTETVTTKSILNRTLLWLNLLGYLEVDWWKNPGSHDNI